MHISASQGLTISPVAGKIAPMQHVLSRTVDPRIGIITALPDELSAVRAVLNEHKREDKPGTGAGRTYWIARVKSLYGDPYQVVIALADMGTNVATYRASRLLEHFPKVEALIMCGIAFGIPNFAVPAECPRLGDVVVSNWRGVVQYDFTTRGGGAGGVLGVINESPRPPSSWLLEAVQILKSDESLGHRPWEELIHDSLSRLKQISLTWTRPDDDTDRLIDPSNPEKVLQLSDDSERRKHQPRIFQGPIASANTLLKDPKYRDELSNHFGVKAGEMEGAGVADATWLHGIGYLVVRGICDYADYQKTKLWQKYAAVAAAAYVRALLESLPSAAPGPVPTVSTVTTDASVLRLKTLEELVRADAVIAETVRCYQQDIQRVHEKIDLMVFLKHLHDMLHDFYLSSYRFVLTQAKRAMHRPESVVWGNVKNPALNDLASLISRLEAVVGEGAPSPAEAGWVARLRQGFESLRGAVTDADESRLIEANNTLSRVLRFEPSRLAREADTVVKYLQLRNLSESLYNVLAALSRLNVPEAEILVVKRGLTDLADFGQGIEQATAEHSAWQTLDEELRRVDEGRVYKTRAFAKEWPFLRNEVHHLLAGAEDPESQQIRNDCRLLTDDLVSKKPVKEPLESLRRLIINRFIAVDKNLKKWCEELRHLRDPLGMILGSLR